MEAKKNQHRRSQMTSSMLGASLVRPVVPTKTSATASSAKVTKTPLVTKVVKAPAIASTPIRSAVATTPVAAPEKVIVRRTAQERREMLQKKLIISDGDTSGDSGTSPPVLEPLGTRPNDSG